MPTIRDEEFADEAAQVVSPLSVWGKPNRFTALRTHLQRVLSVAINLQAVDSKAPDLVDCVLRHVGAHVEHKHADAKEAFERAQGAVAVPSSGGQVVSTELLDNVEAARRALHGWTELHEAVAGFNDAEAKADLIAAVELLLTVPL